VHKIKSELNQLGHLFGAVTTYFNKVKAFFFCTYGYSNKIALLLRHLGNN